MACSNSGCCGSVSMIPTDDGRHYCQQCGEYSKKATSLGGYTTEQLEAEIEARKAKALVIQQRSYASLIDDLGGFCMGIHLNLTAQMANGSFDDNHIHHDWEALMKFLYGPGFFEWYNKIETR